MGRMTSSAEPGSAELGRTGQVRAEQSRADRAGQSQGEASPAVQSPRSRHSPAPPQRSRSRLIGTRAREHTEWWRASEAESGRAGSGEASERAAAAHCDRATPFYDYARSTSALGGTWGAAHRQRRRLIRPDRHARRLSRLAVNRSIYRAPLKTGPLTNPVNNTSRLPTPTARLSPATRLRIQIGPAVWSEEGREEWSAWFTGGSPFDERGRAGAGRGGAGQGGGVRCGRTRPLSRRQSLLAAAARLSGRPQWPLISA